MPVPQSLLSVGFSPNIIEPFGSGANGVMIVGEAPGAEEDERGVPFYTGAQAGSVLERAIRRVGFNREQFVIVNTVPARPPNNWLEGAPWQADATSWGLPLLQEAVNSYNPRCILALGAVASRAVTGLAGPKLGISHLCGYVVPSLFGPPCVPCFHPAYLRRGKMSHMSVLMRCIRLAVQVAAEGRQAMAPNIDAPPRSYCLHPTEDQAEWFLDQIQFADWLAYDIETFYSNAEEEAEDHDDKTIRSIQFSLGPNSGIFMPWREPFIAIAKDILALPIRKCGWNSWRFDDPILRAAGCELAGELNDLMWAWHHLQPDLPRGLQFAAAMQGPAITNPTHVWPWPWKHLDAAQPEFYGIVDVDVLQWMLNY